MTESEMNALREVFADEVGKAVQGLEDRIGARLVAFEASIGQVLDHLVVLEADVGAVRTQLAGITRVDVQRRLDRLEARLAALEGATPHG